MSSLWEIVANKVTPNNSIKTVPASQLNHTDTGLERIVQRASRSPSKIWAWRVVIAILCISLITFIIWFDQSPESYGYGYGIGKSPSEHRLNGLYYWCTLTSTVGFGDICPITPSAKGVTSLYQVFITMLSLGVIWNITDDHVKKLITREQ